MESGAEDLLPVVDSQLFRGRSECGVNRVACIQGCLDDGVGVLVGVEPSNVVVDVDGVKNLDWVLQLGHARSLVVVLEDDGLAKVRARDVGEEGLQCFGIVAEVNPLVAELGHDHLNHEGLEAEAVALLLHQAGPVLGQAHDLGEMLRLGVLALAREVQVQWDAGLQERAVLLANQVAAPVGLACVQDGDNVHVQAGAPKGHRDRVRLRLDLVVAEVGEGLAQAHCQVLEQGTEVVGSIGAADVHGHVDVVEGAQSRSLGQAPRELDALEREVRVLAQVALQLFPQAARLRPVLAGLVFREVDPIFGKANDVAMVNVLSRHLGAPFLASLMWLRWKKFGIVNFWKCYCSFFESQQKSSLQWYLQIPRRTGRWTVATRLGEKLRDLRKERGLTLEALADAARLSKSYLWELENRESQRPSAEKLTALADALGVGVAYFLEEDVRAPQEKHLDDAFFRGYQKLDPDAKEQLRKILSTFKKS